MANTFHLEIVSPEAVLWSGEAALLITRTTEGEIGIMASHQALMGSLVPWSAVVSMKLVVSGPTVPTTMNSVPPAPTS